MSLPERTGTTAEPSSEGLVGRVRARARTTPDERAYLFLRDGEEEEGALSYAGLDRRARAIAAVLRDRGATGEPVLLLFPAGLDFVAAFYGCLYAGAVAVPSYPPRGGQRIDRVSGILRSCSPRLVLTVECERDRVAGFLTRNGYRAEVLAADAVDDGLADGWCDPRLAPDDLAFLQYTSGSTSDPKGVMVTHGNLVANEEMIRAACRHDEGSLFVSWLPMYHDMGLIGGVIQPIWTGASCVLMSPVAFLQRPMRWLEAITRYRAVTSGAPDFAFDLCVRRSTPEDRAALDLSSWRVAFDGAEPVRARTLDRFAQAFEPAGFRRSAFFPCYGLAEATLIVSGVAPDREPGVRRFGRRRQRLVSCGEPIGQAVEIVDPESRRRRRPGEVGEIWVAGPNVAAGYWERPEETGHAFGARLRDGDGGAYLRTGDLGFLRDGELYVTGRLKDLIILRGVNHYPQDVEGTVEALDPDFRPGGVAAFSVEREAEERLVVVQEVGRRSEDRDWSGVLEEVHRAVSERHEVPPWDVVLVRQGSVPRTSSGKVQRYLCRRLYMDGDLTVVASSRAAGPAGGPVAEGEDDDLRRAVVRALRLDSGRIAEDLPLVRLGLDSLGATELGHRLRSEWGTALTQDELLETTVAGLRARLTRPVEAGAEGGEPDPGEAVGAEATVPDEPYPLSTGQLSLWLLEVQDHGSPINHVARALSISASEEEIEAGLARLVERHPVLRTRLIVGGGEPSQAIRAEATVELRREEPEEGSRRSLRSRLTAAAHLPFELPDGPFVRAHLFPVADDDPVLLLVFHHLVVDFWSLAILLDDFLTFLDGDEPSAAVPTEVPAVSYSEHVRRRRAALGGERDAALAAFWADRLRDAPDSLDLPADRPRPARPSHAGRIHPFAMRRETGERLRVLGREAGATPFMVLLTIFQVLLHRYSGADDLLIGSPTTGRDAPELAGLVGYFVNTVVWRADLSRRPSFATQLERTHRGALEVFAHQDYPFARLVEALAPERPPGRMPLVPVLFAYQQAPSRTGGLLAPLALGREGEPARVGDRRLRSVALAERPILADLTLLVAEEGETTLACFDYDPDRFDRATVARMAGHLVTLLEGALAKPSLAVARLPLMAPAERVQVLTEWSRGARRPRGREPVHARFERRAAEAPDALCAVAGGDHLSYAGVLARARAVAAALLDAGLPPGGPVALLTDRSPSTLVGSLGVLLAGGAYLPIDPELPSGRVRTIVRDSGAFAVLVREGGAPPAGDDGPPRIALGRLGDLSRPASVAGTSPEKLQAGPPEGLAYVIYTSGSTGAPKGVEIPHGGLTNLVDWHLEAFGVDAGDRASQVAGLGFDAAVWEVWPYLAAGAVLEMVPDRLRAVPADLWRHLEERRVTVAFLPTPLAEAALRLDGRAAGGLRVLLTGGDRLHHAGGDEPFELINNYGPTEGSVVATSTPVISAGLDRSGLPPIGGPIANVETYVVDRAGEPLPAGVAGELRIGGAGLARGYLGRPGLTAERFVPDPLGDEVGARLYRTGDSTRWSPRGRLEFVSRLDHQVKVRGFRVELGEIEAVLASHPSVADAVVSYRRDTGTGTLLAGYVVPAGGAPVDGDDLRGFAAERLPGYMVPDVVLPIAEVPLTVHGKVDRDALPAPVETPEREPEPWRATPEEEIVAGVWAAALGVERVGLHDDLFARGGHSLVAAAVASRVGEALGVDLSIRDIFEHPTVASLARAARRPGAVASWPRPIREAVTIADTPLAPGQRRIWLLDRMEEAGAAYNVPLALRLSGPLDVSALARAVASVVERHAVLRSVFPAVDGEPVQRPAPAGPILLAIDDLSEVGRDGEDAAAATAVAARAEAARPFDLATEPPFRARLLRLGPERHVLLATLHHVAADGASVALLLDEVEAWYREALGAETAVPAPLPIQFSDYARWLDERSADPKVATAVEADLDEWAGRIADLEPFDLPTDRPRPAVRAREGRTERFAFGPTAAGALARLAREHGASRFMTVMAAFQALLHRVTGQERFAIGTPVSDRARPEVRELIGFFLETVVVPCELGGDPRFDDLLARTRRACLDAYGRRHVPFDRLVGRVAPERDPSRTPLFDVMLSEQPSMPPLRLPGIDAEELPPALPTARFDLSLSVTCLDDLSGRVEYSTALFDSTTVRRLLGALGCLLEGAAERPQARLSELPVTGRAERHHVLREWATGAGHGLPPEPLVASLDRRAVESPDALAVTDGHEHLTHGELCRRSSALAARLRCLGAGPESRIALLLETGAEGICAALATLRAGAAFVPLDPSAPPARLVELLDDCGAELVIVPGGGRPGPTARVLGDRTVVPADADAPGSRAAVPAATPQGDSPSYVIFTSGSTGRPKGVVVTHRGLESLVAWHRGRFAIGRSERASLIASPAFDASVWEVWPYLAAGASVHRVPEAARAVPDALAHWLAAQRITVAFLPTPLAEAFLAGRKSDDDLPARLLTGGDRLRRATPPRGVELVNNYGPTEATVVATSWPVGWGTRPGEPPPIGRPVAGIVATVRDARLRPLPIGAAGELCLGGDALARGYLDRRGLTAERFVPDPEAGRPGARCYRTGDLCRFRSDGALRFVGRIDRQISLRGQRIEPGEIESALAALDGVEAAVVERIAGAAESCEADRLVAWVVPSPGRRPSADELRRALTERLPGPMVPSAVVLLDELPITANGKIDRSRLPVPPASTGGASRPPRTATERALAVLWERELGIERIGADDDFFALGGHSLQAARLAAAVGEELGVEVALRRFLEAATVARLAAEVDRAAGGRAVEAIERVPRDRPLRLSPGQERLWFLDRLDEGRAVYNLATALDLDGRLGTAALARALAGLVARHESLRTRYAEGKDGPVQVVLPPEPPHLSVIDLSALGAGAAEAVAAGLARDAATQPFDLARDPALRLRLVRVSAERHALLIALHHIAGDGRSLAIFARELGALYAGALERTPEGDAPGLPDLPVQYADFAAWQRRRLARGDVEPALRRTLRRLTGLESLQLPTDRPRPAVRRGRGAVVRSTVPGEVVGRLERLARERRTTLFVVLLAAFEAVLARVSGGSRFGVSTPVDGRERVEVRDLIGFFVDTLVVPADAGGDPTFGELVERVRATWTATLSDREVPFGALVEELRPERDLAMPPVVQAMLALNPEPPVFDLLGLAVRRRPLDPGTSRLDLTLAAESSDRGLELAAELDGDLFDSTTVIRLLGRFGTTLAGAAEDPSRRLSELVAPPRPERHQLLREWSGEALESTPVVRPLHGWVAEAVAATPDRIAVVDGHRRLSYAALWRAAGRIAEHLRRADATDTAGSADPIGPRVAVCVTRSAALVASVLGVLRSGRAYVPVDPAYPEERKRTLAEDSGVRWAVTDDPTAHGLTASGVRPIVVASPAGRSEVSEAPDDPRLDGSPTPLDAPAYLIYTSGSTGRPKGVEIGHRAASAFVAWTAEHAAPGDLDGVAFTTSVCFDLSVFEMFAPLARGGTVLVAGSVLDLADLPARREVTLVNTVPSGLSELLRLDRLPEGVRTIQLAGEVLDRALVDRVPRLGPNGIRPRVVNLYGPSEDTTYSTVAPVSPGDRAEPSIGRPLAGGRALILDPFSRPVPLGVVGELCLAGTGLATGYLGRPAATAERFVPDPFDRRGGGRLYRTGDLARHRGDGELEFRGRFDHQVKLRGFRIELGEVEAALAAHEDVGEAVAVVRGAGTAAASLVAFVSPAGTEAPRPEEVVRHLRALLPAHAVPSRVVALAELPRLPNGKVDRRSLPEADSPAGGDRTPPRTPLEERLAALWGEVLECEAPGVHANFFDLGGHSLLVTRLVARARRALGLELAVRDLFQAPTVAGLAARIESRIAPGIGGAPDPIRRRPDIAGDAPLSFAQQRVWFLDRMEGVDEVYNLPLVVRLRGPLDAGALAGALGDLVTRHEALRTRLPAVGGRPVQRIEPPPAIVPLSVEDLLSVEDPDGRTGDTLRAAAEREVRRPFDLAAGPPIRARLLRAAPDDHTLVLTLHHAVADGWSLALLYRDLAALYAARRDGDGGEPPELPKLPLTYADFAVWQRRELTPERLVPSLEARRERLASVPATELPADRSRPPVQTHGGGVETIRVPAPIGEAVAALARSRRATPFMAVTTALAVLLHRYTGQRRLALGTPVSGRERVEIEDVVGLFANTVALPVRPEPDAGFGDLLASVRDETLEALVHQHLPFETLVDALGAERSLAHSPIFQVMVAAQRAARERRFAGMEAERVDVHTGTSKFDLTLFVLEDEEDGGGLELALEYRTDLFDRTTAARMVRRIPRLLREAAEAPERAIGRLSLLDRAERHQALRGWQGSVALRPPSVAERFARQAARTPEAPAVRRGGETWTYRRLRAEVEDLAAVLRSRGVGSETLVGVCLSRTPRMVSALLAVFTAGGAYVPLDPSYPRERLAFMLEDSGARLVLTERALAERLPEGSAGPSSLPGTEVLCLDELPPGGGGGAQAGPPPGDADRLAYVIFTSGSTGWPKGVAIREGALAELVEWSRGPYREADLAGVVASTSICFDLSAFELFVPLARGGSIVLVEDALALGGLDGAGGEARLLNTVPSAAAELVRRGALPGSVDTVNVAGEPLRRDLVDALLATGSVRRVLNLYGPSEDTTYSTWCSVPAGAVPAIGRPVDGTRSYVLDAEGSPVPIGGLGELHLGGAGLARGYLGRPAATAERFVPDPFGDEVGARLYRTGDLCRHQGDGQLQFLGRLDHQVKIRGFRIEPGEVESVLARHPTVREAVVVAASAGAGGAPTGLVAYLAVEGGEPDLADLRGFMAGRLPDFMMPTAWVALDELPRLPNGKVDRTALPAPDHGRLGPSTPYVEPVTALEVRLAEVWRRVLGVERVGLHDDFFELGGHSLLAVELLFEVEEETGEKLPVEGLFRQPTVHGMARLLEAPEIAGEDEEDELELVALPRERFRRPAGARSAEPEAGGS